MIKDILVYGSRDLLLKLNCASGGMDHREIGYYYRSGILTATFDAHSYKCNYSYRLKVGMTRDYILVKPQSNQIYIYSKGMEPERR